MIRTITLCLHGIRAIVLCATPCAAAEPAKETAPESESAYLRRIYREEAEKHVFYHDADRRQPLELIDHPIMRWDNEGTWSGDVFVWTHKGRPEVIGCMLSGPRGDNLRYVYDEFHLVADQPISPAVLQTRQRWQPEHGLAKEPLEGAAKPAASSAGRLTQMRRLTREITAHMQADKPWELRLLPQPVFRYQAEESGVMDGALFVYVWGIGTDPELILLLECRRKGAEVAWHYAPIRFSNRALWLKRDGREIWRVDAHREPAGTTSAIYTTAFARSIPRYEPQRQTRPANSE